VIKLIYEEAKKEGVIQNVTGNHRNDRRGFLTILDNILSVNELARGKNQMISFSLDQEAS
jgi:hypothetical protein